MSPQTAHAATLLGAIMGYRMTQAVYVAAMLGIADLLEDGPQSSEALARSVGAPADTVHRVLRALASIGIFEETADGHFAPTPAGALLRSSAPDSLRAAAIFFGDHRHWEQWGHLIDSVKSGVPARGTFSDDAFAQRALKDPEGMAIFNSAMSALTAPVHAGVLAAYDFSAVKTLVDVGGGHGALIAAILTANSEIRGILFDIPAVIEGARTRIEAAGLSSRCRLEAGDFFKEVPSGADTYMLKWVIHDWDDERSLLILKNCRAAMSEGNRLLLIERVLPQRAQPTPSAVLAPFFADLNMLVLTSGRERTEEEYRRLLGAAGFKVTRNVPTPPPFPHGIIEAVAG